MSRTVRLGILLLAGILSFVATHQASAACISSDNSHLAVIEGIETCAGTGGGCSACFTSGRRGGGSWDLCYYDYHTGDLACTYYN
jgi:hypothetical protein